MKVGNFLNKEKANYIDSMKRLQSALKRSKMLDDYDFNIPEHRNIAARKLANCKMYRATNAFKYITYEVIYDFCNPTEYKNYVDFEKVMKETKVEVAQIISDKQDAELTKKQAMLEETEEKLAISRHRNRVQNRGEIYQTRLLAELEEFRDSIRKLQETYIYDPSEYQSVYTPTDSVMFVCLSDIHLGKAVDVSINKINKDIIRQRVVDFVQIAKNKIAIQKPKKVVIAMLGDYIEGLIHGSCLAESDISSASDQMLEAGKIIVHEVIKPIAKVANSVLVTGVSGNHDVTIRKHTDRTNGDTYFTHLMNMITLEICKMNYEGIPHVAVDKQYGFDENDVYFYAKTYNHADLYLFDDKIKVTLVHGEYLSKKGSFVEKVCFGGRIPDYVLAGHFHAPSVNTSICGSSLYYNGSLCGPDSFSSPRGMVNEPSQKIFTITRTVLNDNIENGARESFIVEDCNVPLLYGWRGENGKTFNSI